MPPTTETSPEAKPKPKKGNEDTYDILTKWLKADAEEKSKKEKQEKPKS